MHVILPMLLAALLVASPAPGAAGSTMTVEGAGGATASVYVVRRDTGQHAPAVVILHGCEGFDAHDAAIADDFSRAGYAAVALADTTDACTDRHGSRNAARAARIVLAWIRTQPSIDATRIVLVGFSMGAIAVLDLIDSEHGAAAPAGVLGAVTYYPQCAGRSASDLHVPLLILDGSADTVTPPGPCRDLASGSAAIAIHTYPGATHAFDVDAPARTFRGSRLAYDAAAARDARIRTLGFLLRVASTPGGRRGSPR